MGSSKPRAVSEFYAELATVVAQAVADPAVDSEGLVVDIDVPVPDDGTPNPLAAHVINSARVARRPPQAMARTSRPERRALGRATLDRAGAAVTVRRRRRSATPRLTPTQMWRAEVDVLLDEHAQANRWRRRRTAGAPVGEPTRRSARGCGHLRPATADRCRSNRTLARCGTAFHAWVERRFGATRLLDIDELPGAADETAVPEGTLAC